MRFQVGLNLNTWFEATAFDTGVDAPRRNRDFDLTDDERAQLRLKEIEAWVAECITDHSERLLKKLSSVEVENSCLAPMR